MIRVFGWHERLLCALAYIIDDEFDDDSCLWLVGCCERFLIRDCDRHCFCCGCRWEWLLVLPQMLVICLFACYFTCFARFCYNNLSHTEIYAAVVSVKDVTGFLLAAITAHATFIFYCRVDLKPSNDNYTRSHFLIAYFIQFMSNQNEFNVNQLFLAEHLECTNTTPHFNSMPNRITH